MTNPRETPPPITQSEDGGMQVSLRTKYAQSVLRPSPFVGGIDQQLSDVYAHRFSVRRGQGYPIEDAVVLALMDAGCDEMPTAEQLAAPLLVPTLIDEQSRSREFLCDRHRSAFAPLIHSRPGPYPIVSDLPMLRQLLDAGAAIIQLRVKTEPNSIETSPIVQESVRIAADYPQSQLFINDHWKLAIDHGAYGVHLGQEDLLDADLRSIHAAGIRLGLSSHAYWEVARAMTIRPSYIACGPIFPTRAKAMPWVPQGIPNLQFWSRLIPCPVIGIGGVTLDNLRDCWSTGCDAVSMIAAVTKAPDPAIAMRDFKRAWERLESMENKEFRSENLLEIAAPTLI
jgi:hydroxymethylpyrimidine kinase/phosphomethylpyrimidine kinase/thiamine-phosphate diphosphorylase